MGVFKNDVGRPTNETIKKRRILKALLALLVAGALFTGGYYVNDLIKKQNSNDSKTDNKEELNIESNEVIDLFNKYNLKMYWLNSDNSYSGPEEFYKDDVNKNSVSDSIKFAISLGNLYLEKESGETTFGEQYEYYVLNFDGIKEIKLDELNKKSEELFDSKINVNNILNKDKNVNIIIEGYQFKYDKDKKNFTYEEFGIGDSVSYEHKTKIIKSNMNNDKIEIINKVMFSACYDEVCYISKTKQDINNIKDIIVKVDSQEEIIIDDYLDKLDSFKWTFVKNSEGNYIFESVEKIK